jgi:16S rRNA (guanine966-N2)-methyltransferase
MRVISGKFKKKKILLPDPKITRPLRDYVKESLFNLLTHTKSLNFEFDKSIVLDIFSGSGSFGIECLSRGSERAIFIEKNKDTLSILKKNINNFLLNNQCGIIFDDFLKINLNEVLKENVNLIFLDPPFEYAFLKEIFDKLRECHDQLSECLIMIHYEKNNDFKFDDYLNIVIKKKYGRSVIVFAKIKSQKYLA